MFFFEFSEIFKIAFFIDLFRWLLQKSHFKMANQQKLCKRIQILSEPRLAAASVTYVATLIEINFHKRHMENIPNS